MSYADATYYTDTFKGVLIPSGELDKFLQDASDNVDQVTLNRVTDFSALTAFQQGCLQKATCAQAEHLYSYKDLLEGIGGYNTGDNSVSIKNFTLYSSRALNYLTPSGFRYRGL